MSPISSTVHISTHPVVVSKLTILRDKKSSSKVFRDVMTDLSVLLGYEATQDLELKTDETVKTTVFFGCINHHFVAKVNVHAFPAEVLIGSIFVSYKFLVREPARVF